MTYEVKLPIGLHEGIPPVVCNDPAYRLTIGMLICVDGKLLMLKSALATAEGYRNWWTLPQEGFQLQDGNLLGSVKRGMREELGYAPPEKSFYTARVLGDMKNRIPSSRRKDRGCKKHILFVGMRTRTFPISLDFNENVAHKLVSSWDELDDAMAEVAEHRIQKYICTCDMVNHACECGLLPWKTNRM